MQIGVFTALVQVMSGPITLILAPVAHQMDQKWHIEPILKSSIAFLLASYGLWNEIRQKLSYVDS